MVYQTFSKTHDSICFNSLHVWVIAYYNGNLKLWFHYEYLTIIIYLKLWHIWILVCVLEGQGRCHPCNRNLEASNLYWVERQAVFEEVDFHSRSLLHKRWSRERQTFGRVSWFSLNNVQLRYYDLLDIN